MNQPTLLVCTVGGTAQPVAAAIKGCKPDRVIFVASPETAPQAERQILPLLRREGLALSPGQYEVAEVPDAEDFAGCVERIRELSPQAEGWVRRGPDYRVVVDLTGGTKCMSAALALVARRWPCLFSYVGGTERTKDGLGIVVNGRERVLHIQNPWDSLGYQAEEEAIVLFNRGDYQAAIHVLDEGRRAVERPDLKRELNCLKLLAEAYLACDLFEHTTADQRLADVQKSANDLRHPLPAAAEAVLRTIAKHREFLGLFLDSKLGKHVLLDLCANARRCADRGRYDDAVARLYRALEALAQLRLTERYHLPDTGEVPLEEVPEPLRSQWASRARDGFLYLGLQEDYRLLNALGDDLGRRFYDLGLDGRKSPLSARNQSILAHGFTPVGPNVFRPLWDKTLTLAGIAEDELPVFPRIGEG